jgi:hypothetical protein
MGGAWVFAIATMLDCAGVGDPRYDGGIKFFFAYLTGDKVPRELAASGIEHRNRAENRAVYGA